MPEGWIKLHRSLLDNPVVCKDGDHMAVWIYLLLKVTHAELDVIFRGERITLMPGQQLFGRKSISTKLTINEYKVQRILKTFENAQQIAQQTSPQNRLISILNWDLYQDAAQQDEQQLHNDCTTTAQRLHTNKNIRTKEQKNLVNICPSEPVDIPVDKSADAKEIYESYIPYRKRKPAMTISRIDALIKKYGAAKVKTAVQRYKEAVKGTDPQFIKQSDGFFQDDYIKTFMADGYKAEPKPKGRNVTSFNDYDQREGLDYNALELELLGIKK